MTKDCVVLRKPGRIHNNFGLEMHSEDPNLIRQFEQLVCLCMLQSHKQTP